MKADRRHELQENDLAQMLESVRTGLSQNARSIGFAVLAVVAVFVVASLAMRTRAVAREDRWRRYGQLLYDKPETARDSLGALESMANGTSDRNFVLTALIERGRQSLSLGQRGESGPNREFLTIAAETYQRMIKDFGDNPLAFGVAHSGLATVAENMFVLTREQKYRDEAAEHLNAIVKAPFMQGLPFQRLAVDRLASLNQTFSLVEFGPPVGQPVAGQLAPPPLLAAPGNAPQGITVQSRPVAVQPPAAEPALVDTPESEYGADPADPPVEKKDQPANP